MIRALAILLLAGPAAAQDGPTVDPAPVRARHEGASPYDVAPACIGAPANLCQGEPGGAWTDGIVGCLSSEAAAWDDLPNEEYGLLRSEPGAADARGGLPGATPFDRAQAHRDAQRAWIAFRAADCALARAIWQDGTIRGPLAASCRLRRTARRALELRDLRRSGEGDL